MEEPNTCWERYARAPSNMRRIERSPVVRSFFQAMHYQPSHHVILSEAKNEASDMDCQAAQGSGE